MVFSQMKQKQYVTAVVFVSNLKNVIADQKQQVTIATIARKDTWSPNAK